jgi:hypothetical protein
MTTIQHHETRASSLYGCTTIELDIVSIAFNEEESYMDEFCLFKCLKRLKVAPENSSRNSKSDWTEAALAE